MIGWLIGLTIGYFILSVVVGFTRMSLRGTFVSPVNYEYRLLTNFNKIKIQLKIPSLVVLFGDKWEDYQAADSMIDAMNMLYRTKYFKTELEAEEFIEKCKQQDIERRKREYFVEL